MKTLGIAAAALLLSVTGLGGAWAVDAAAPTAPLASPADLHGRRIAVAMGSAQETYASQAYPDATILQYQTVADAVLAVSSGKADASIKDEVTLRELLRQNDSLAALGESLFSSPLAAGFHKDKAVLRSQFNHFLQEIRQNGVYEDMANRWIRQLDTNMPPIANSGKNGELTIGAAVFGLPFAAVKDNAYTGFEFELMNRFAASIGKKPIYLIMDIPGMIAAVASGKADMLAGLYDTEERRKRIAFSDSYFQMGNQFFALKSRVAGAGGRDATASGGAVKIASAADLHGRRIAVMVGTAYESYATKTFADSTILEYQTPSDVVMAVKTGKADASINDVDTLAEILRTNDTLGAVGESVFSFKIGVGFRKDNAALRAQYDAFLREIRQNGIYDAMLARWMTQVGGQMPAIAESHVNGDLLIGTSIVGLPIASIENNELVGFDIEMMTRFAASMGKRPKFLTMEFGALIAALASGKVDLIAAEIFITPERQLRIDFSEPYYEVGNKIYALKQNIAGGVSVPAVSAAPGSSFWARLVDSFQSNIIQERRYLLILDGLQTTVVISIFATLFGTALGGLVCFMRMARSPLLSVPARIYISTLRGTPVLVLLMLVFYVVFGAVRINPTLVAVIAFGLNFAAYFAEIFRSGMSGLDPGQQEAGIAMGFTPAQTFLNVLLPQTIVRILPVYKGEFISLVKMTSVVGYIAVQDLTKAGDIIRSRTFDAFFPLVMVAILYFAVSWILMQALEYLERRTDPVVRRRQGSAK